MNKLLAALIVTLISSRAYADYSPGGFANAYAIPCTPFATGPEVLVMSQAGVFYPSANQLNRIGDTYYVGVTVGTVGLNCSHYTGATIELILPPNTQPAISTTNPIVCGRSDNGTLVTVPAADCPQTLSAGYRGGVMLPKVYTIPYGSTYYLSIPVMSTKPLNGLHDKVKFGVNSISADATWLFPEVGVWVEDRAPDYTAMGTTSSNVGKRAFTAKVELYSFFRPGKVHFEYGTTTSYGSISDSFDVGDGIGYAAESDVDGLTAGVTYHWRARFVADDGSTAVTPDQTVTTLPPERFVLTVSANAGGTVAKSPDAADYVEETIIAVTASPQSGYRFAGWSLDGAPVAGSVAQMTVKMDRKHEVVASFEVLPPGMSSPQPEPQMNEPPPMNPNPATPDPEPSSPKMEPVPTAPLEPMQGGCQTAPATAMALGALALLLRRRR